MLYEYIVESNKGVFHWALSPSKHIFMNGNVIAFCNPFNDFKIQWVTLYSVFHGGTQKVDLRKDYDEPKLTLPVIKSHKPGYVSIQWGEDDVTIVTPEDDWKSVDDELIEHFIIEHFN